MPDPESRLESIDNAPVPPSQQRRAYAQPLLTSLASGIVPGLGQFVQGRVAAGAWFSSFAAIIGLVVMLRVFSTYTASLTSLFLIMGLSCASAGDAFLSSAPTDRLSPPRILIALPIIWAFVFSCVTWNLLFLAAGFKLYSVPSTAMEPTIEKGDRVAADLRAYETQTPRRGDMIIMSRGNIVYLKRVIGLPGDLISIRDGVVWINSQPIAEPYVQFSQGQDAWGRNLAAPRVPEHSYFVMGDSRDVSLDSRSEEFGLVKQKEIKGQVLYAFDSRRVGRHIDHGQASPVSGAP
jgi:signal peptidase I